MYGTQCSILLIHSLAVLALHPPFERAIIYPSPHSRSDLNFLTICQGNRDAQMILQLQYFVLGCVCDEETCHQIIAIDPAQAKIYEFPITEDNIFDPFYTSLTLSQYARSIFEVGILSLATALLPNAPQVWLDTVFGVYRFFHRTDHFKTPSLFIYAPTPLVSQEVKSTSYSSDKGCSGCSLSPYDHSVNFSNES